MRTGSERRFSHTSSGYLETSYLLVRLPAYAVNHTKRVIKSPNLYWGENKLGMERTLSLLPGYA